MANSLFQKLANHKTIIEAEIKAAEQVVEEVVQEPVQEIEQELVIVLEVVEDEFSKIPADALSLLDSIAQSGEKVETMIKRAFLAGSSFRE